MNAPECPPFKPGRWAVAALSSIAALSGAAAAAGGGLRVFDPEGRPAQRFDVVDRAAIDQIEADRVDHQPHPGGFGHQILVLNLLARLRDTMHLVADFSKIAG